MFERISFEDWQVIFSIIGFAIFFVVFIAATLRILLTRKKSINKIESLPLEQETHIKDSHGRKKR